MALLFGFLFHSSLVLLCCYQEPEEGWISALRATQRPCEEGGAVGPVL